MPRVDAKYIPLNVTTYREGFLRLRGWTCVSALAFITAGLLVVYELVLINVEDRDWRDMLFDYRVTQPGIIYQHKHFVNAQFCCNNDPAVFGYTCHDSDVSAVYHGAPFGWYAPRHPYCPPTVRFTCANLASTACVTTRQAVYAAAGLSNSTGRPINCTRAGRVRLRAQQALGETPTATRLQVEWAGQARGAELVVPDSASADPHVLAAFFDDAARRYADPLYVSPLAPLSRSLTVDGVGAVALAPGVSPGDWDTNLFGWPWELWPWPPGWACPNTGRPPALYLNGSVRATLPPYTTAGPAPSITLRFYGDPLSLPAYQVSPAAALSEIDPAASLEGPSLPFWVPEFAAAVADSSVAASGPGGPDAQGQVVLRALSGVTLRAGIAPALDACSAWMLDKEWVDTEYGIDVWRGTRGDLARLASDRSLPTLPASVIAIRLRDVSEPLPLALPRYGGNAYIYGAITAGGVWMFSTVPLLAAYALVVVNVQRNRGLPLFIYKYMRAYRGW